MAGAFNIEKVPSWAYNWCYYFAAIAALSLLTGISALFFVRQVGLGFTALYAVSALVQASTAMTLFWMCRTSLRTTDAAHIKLEAVM